VWERLEKTGIRVEKYERGEYSGREQGVDQCLQLWMLRALADAPVPATAVLLTGDGKGYEDGAGFRADLERLHAKGWGIELIAWEKTCARRLREWASQVGVFVRLEDHYGSVTFLEERRRRAKPVDLADRRLADPEMAIISRICCPAKVSDIAAAPGSCGATVKNCAPPYAASR
jgi:hypothetical protein